LQTERDFELIAVDDGSEDNTWERLQGHPSRPVCLKIPNSGAGIARNEGVKLAKGRYLAFLDSDDLWFPYTLALYRQIISDYAAPNVMTGKPVLFQSVDELRITDPSPQEVEVFPDYYASFDDWRWHGVSSFVIARAAFERAGGFCSKRMNAEDADLMMKLGTEPNFVHIRHPAPFAYRRHNGNLTANLQLSTIGLQHLIDTEIQGQYPGGQSHRRKRRIIITRHLRPTIINGLIRGSKRDVWPIFRKSLWWHVREARMRFLAFCFYRFIMR
jgi:glycosyltransferase involved in cell wall biosynthesis